MERYQFQVECAHAEIPRVSRSGSVIRSRNSAFRPSLNVGELRAARSAGERKTYKLKVDSFNIYPYFLLSSIDSIDNF